MVTVGKERNHSPTIRLMGNQTTSRGWWGMAILGSCLLLLFMALQVDHAGAQITLSTIRGLVSDQSGAVIPGVGLTLTELQTGLTRTSVTDAAGNYEIPDLKPGTYRLQAQLAGFKTYVADNLILTSSQIRRIDVNMEVGQTATQITVNASAAVIDTEGAKIQAGVTEERYLAIPSVSNFFDPNTTLATMPNVQSPMGGYGVSFAGQPQTQIQEGMDGHTNDGIVNQINNMEDSAELQAVMVNNTAEYSRVGYFNLTTRSGTNAFHGRAYYYQENSALGTRNFFDAEKNKLLIHTFGANVGGPIKKDKLFFYGSWNSMRVPSKSFFLRNVPTEKFRTGDFSELTPLGISIKDPLTGNPFPDNVIPSSRFSDVSQKVQDQYFPKPNTGAPGDLVRNYSFRFEHPEDLYRAEYIMGRLDYNISRKNSVYGRYVTNWFFYILPGSYPGLEWTRLRHNYHVVLVDTHIFSPTLVNAARFGYYQEMYHDGDTVGGFTPQYGDQVVKAIGLQGVNQQNLSAQGFPRMDVTGYSSLRVNPGGFVWNDKDWGFADSLTWSKAKHVWKFGAEYKPFSHFNGAIPEGTYGSFSFNGTWTGNAYADFLLGLPYSSSRLNPLVNRTQSESEFGLYAQDTFKLNPKLTIDYGLRWEYFGPASYDDGLHLRWDKDTGNIVVEQAALSKVSPLYPSNIKIVAGQVVPNADKKLFVPRLGAAYRLSDKMVIRGGYGIFNETLGRQARSFTGGPFQLTETFLNTIQGGQALFSFPDPFPTSPGRVPSQSATGYPLDTSNGRIHQFNLTLERQVKDIGIRLSYLGSRSRGLNYSLGINKPEPSLTPFSASQRPYPQFVRLTYFYNDGEANYDAFTLRANRKVGQLAFDAHWTWAHNMSNYLNLENPYDRLHWNRDAYTPRHRVVANDTWNIPVGRGRQYLNAGSAVTDYILGGWTMYFLSFFQTGSFFSPGFSGSDPSNTGTSGGLPDRIANGNLPTDKRTIDRWFDSSAFAVPPAGRFGNSGVNVLEGPGLNVQHVTVSKRFRIGEKLSLQYQCAISDIFNHPNFHFPASNISVPGEAGTISSLYSGSDLFNLEKADNRRIEMRLRLEW